jgi:hypothetical protein
MTIWTTYTTHTTKLLVHPHRPWQYIQHKL